MRAHPAILLVGLLGGIFELGLSSILPLYGLALDLPSNTATLLVAISGLGGTLFAIPAGMLADRFHSPAQGRRRMMHALVSVLLLSAVASAWVPSSLPYLGSIVCIWGGAGGALYTLAMTAVLVLTYTSGGMLASGLSGWLIDLSPTRLFPLVLISVAALGWVGLRRLR
jgi:MFS family permease